MDFENWIVQSKKEKNISLCFIESDANFHYPGNIFEF